MPDAETAGVQSNLSAPVLTVHTGFAAAVDLYWLALASLRNVLEDVAGADGRVEYLYGLRTRLIATGYEIDCLISGRKSVAKEHQLAVALESGLPSLGLSAADIVGRLAFDTATPDTEQLKSAMFAFGDVLLRALPGDIPESQGPSGQGQILRAMRLWSKIAASTGDDLGFLANRFREL